ncbi:MAG TPA: cyclic nucleotide-binding domain-containing protein, partial [Anaerolineales bacterium]|nr:cyclic nucleotide-binding domain-containing protein [Anaerolineales bacterium]
MSISNENLIAFLRQRQLFKDMEEEEIAEIANRMKEKKLSAGESLFKEGDEATALFFIYSGNIRSWKEEYEHEGEIAILEAGDKIGVESMLFNRNRQVNTAALVKTTLLYLNPENFEWMLETFPQTADYLSLLANSRQQARHQQFHWLQKREAIHIITRRHPARLWIDLLPPAVLIAISLAVILYLTKVPGLSMVSTIIGYTFLVFAILWVIWEFIDWRNDYFIITNQRVVWLEQVVLQGSSRREAPLAAVQSVDVQTSQVGRILDYGNVLVRTFTGTGSMKLTDVNKPKQFMGEIEELLLRVRKKSQVTYEEKLRFSVRESLGLETEEVEDPIFHIAAPEAEPRSGLALLRTRLVSSDGKTITYHRHWWVLLTKTWLHLIFLTGLFALLIYAWVNQYTILGFQFPLTTFYFIWVIGFLFFLGWIAYHYLDWKNDIYMINEDDMIIDAEKKPFGEEISRSAPIRNIISLEHNRVGILRLMLNFGHVKVVVADTVLDFIDVHNPAQVQQDIYYRQEQIKMRSEAEEMEEDRKQIAKWLRAYHDVVEEERTRMQDLLAEEDE